MRTPVEGRRDPAPPDDANDADPVDEAVEESFPASDPPSWEPLHSGTPEPPGAGTPGAGTPDAPPDRPAPDAPGAPDAPR